MLDIVDNNFGIWRVWVGITHPLWEDIQNYCYHLDMKPITSLGGGYLDGLDVSYEILEAVI